MAPGTPYEHILLDNILHQLQDLNHNVGILNQDVAAIKTKQTTIEQQIAVLTAPKPLINIGQYTGLVKYAVPVLLALMLAISQAIAPTTPEEHKAVALERKHLVQQVLKQAVPDTTK